MEVWQKVPKQKRPRKIPEVGEMVRFDCIHGSFTIDGTLAQVIEIKKFETRSNFPKKAAVCIRFEDLRITWCRIDECIPEL
jgi:hypothetical protein